ncbi:hypothetical protein [Methylobacterium sp. A54F]
MARSRFWLSGAGRPRRGREIVIDITQSWAGEDEHDSKISPIDLSVERADNHLMAAHEALLEAEDPHLQLLAEVLLLKIGRKLARPAEAEQGKFTK